MHERPRTATDRQRTTRVSVPAAVPGVLPSSAAVTAPPPPAAPPPPVHPNATSGARQAGLGPVPVPLPAPLPAWHRDLDTHYAAVVSVLAVGVIVQNRSGVIVSANDAACRILALPHSEVVGRTGLDNRWRAAMPDGRVLPADAQPGLAALRTGQPQRDVAMVVRQPDERARWLHVTAVPVLDDDGRPTAVVTTLTDVTADREREFALRRSEEQFRLSMEHTPIGFALVDLEGRFVRVNRALCALLGYQADQLRDRTLSDVTHPDDLAEVAHQIRRMLRGERNVVEFEKRWVRRGGETIWGLLSIALAADDLSGPQYLIVQIQDVTESRRANDLLTHLALHDPLTGLPNRTLVLDRIQKALDRGRRSGRHVAVLFCDLDHFKVVNDSMGHEVGDAVLVEISRRLGHALRAGDTAGRLGGDEFVVVCEDVGDEQEAIVVAERVQAAVREPATVGGRVVVPTVSIGIAVSGSHDVDPLTLLRDADTAMYRAKDHGRDRWDIVDIALRRRAMDRLDIEHALRAGLERGQLRLFYQPIVDLTTGRAVGREALLRWMHPERGLLAPAEFLHVAEESGLIGEIGRWVLGEATRMAGAAGSDSGYVAINVSAAQVSRPGLSGQVAAALIRSGLEAHRLVVELTESVMLSAAPSARPELAALDSLGVRVVVDDFGTGFSALSYLRDLPVSGIKVDRSFTAGMGLDPQCDRIVEALTGLGRGLGLDVVVEGVETPAQRDLLLELGCERAQGYLFGAPSPHYTS